MFGRFVQSDPPRDATRLCGGERLAEGRQVVDVQVIAYHLHLLGLRIVVVNDSLQQMGEVDLRAPLSRLDAPPAAKRLVKNEQIGGPPAPILVVGSPRAARRGRDRFSDILSKLTGPLVDADDRAGPVVAALVEI